MELLNIQKEYGEFATKTFRIPVEFVEVLERVAKEKNTSVNKVVIQCIEYALDNLDEGDSK